MCESPGVARGVRLGIDWCKSILLLYSHVIITTEVYIHNFAVWKPIKFLFRISVLWKEAIHNMPCWHENSVTMATEAYTGSLLLGHLLSWYFWNIFSGTITVSDKRSFLWKPWQQKIACIKLWFHGLWSSHLMHYQVISGLGNPHKLCRPFSLILLSM